ncbi:uncharacterized protein KY384_000020 [Bacidia gigantensis]|uniref:uncharacterized protein n=1 Tax=Bacidia gigantensis TaxID=2732470 RepID=UPI001D03AE3E|nr:uncharacterized protein KY384_000020 [Bacidia gigantensis]KAG8526427.1 hypothetical protein KY384_000020 [Bacidia gigantensis]
MGLPEAEIQKCNYAKDDLDACTAASTGCIRAVVQSTEFKNFIQAAAEKVPFDIAPILKNVTLTCTSARLKHQAEKQAHLNAAIKVATQAVQRNFVNKRKNEFHQMADPQSYKRARANADGTSDTPHQPTLTNGNDLTPSDSPCPGDKDALSSNSTSHSDSTSVSSDQVNPQEDDSNHSQGGADDQIDEVDDQEDDTNRQETEAYHQDDKFDHQEDEVDDREDGVGAGADSQDKPPSSSATSLLQSTQTTVQPPLLPKIDISDPGRCETGILRQDTNFQNAITKAWRKTPVNQPLTYTRAIKVLDQFAKLWLQRKGAKLYEYLADRKESKGQADFDLPSTWDMDDPIDLLKAIDIIRGTGFHYKIHKAFAQMTLARLVEKESEDYCDIRHPSSRHNMKLAPHLCVLENIAVQESPHMSETGLKAKEGELKNAYRQGKRWLEVCEEFGGSGAVLVFVTVKISPSTIVKDFRDSQFDFFLHLAEKLPTITSLIKSLGENALEQYCRFGNLPQEIRAALQRTENTLVIVK